jgi:hypothetical protein
VQGISGANAAGVPNLAQPQVSNNPDFFSLLKVKTHGLNGHACRDCFALPQSW